MLFLEALFDTIEGSIIKSAQTLRTLFRRSYFVVNEMHEKHSFRGKMGEIRFSEELVILAVLILK